MEYFTPIIDDDNDDNDDNDEIDFVPSKIAFVPLDFEIFHVVTSDFYQHMYYFKRHVLVLVSSSLLSSFSSLLQTVATTVATTVVTTVVTTVKVMHIYDNTVC